MTSVEDGRKVAAKSVRKISLETGSPKPSDGEVKTLRRVRSDSLATAAPTFNPKFLMDEKNNSSRKKKINLDLPDAALSQPGDLAKVQTKKPLAGQRRKSSVHQGMVLDVAALHKLKKKQECDDRLSICSSMQSIKTSPSPDLSPVSQHGDQSRTSPSLHITYSPDTEDRVSFGEGSESSSVYHSSCMYPPEEGAQLLGHYLEDPRKNWSRSKRRMSSPTIQALKRQQMQDGSNTLGKVLAFPGEGCRHSTQDVPNLLSFELAALPSKSKFYSTQEDLTTTSTPPHKASTQQRDSPDPPTRENSLTPPVKGPRGSIDSQAQGKQRQESNKELADQHCRSNFGIMLSVICFVLFLWYLGMASSKFIKSALTFESINKIPSPEVVTEVTVYITAGDQ